MAVGAMEGATVPTNPVDLTHLEPEPAPSAPAVPVSESLRRWRNPNPLTGWVVTGGVVAVAALVRFWALGWPRGKMFDEVYYANEAQEILRYGYEDNRAYIFVVHPPLGKQLIAATSWLFGNDEVGWRFAGALAGTLAVLMLTRTALRMFRSNLFAGVAGGLLALDGVSVVQSRTALLDIFLQVFVVAGFAALVVDRDQLRSRLARLVETGVDLRPKLPALGPRPWRLVAGVMFGLALAVKWSALSFWVAFVLLSLWWDRCAYRAAGVRHRLSWTVPRSALPAVGSLFAAPIGAYLLTWTGWLQGEVSTSRHWADAHAAAARLKLPFGLRLPFDWGWLPGPIRAMGDYHLHAFQFHEGLHDPHPYDSNPWNWLVLGRPVDFFYDGNGTTCGAAQCSREVLLIGTPIMWWAFLPALLWLAWHWVTTRDWRAGAVWVAFLAGWAVWLLNTKRTMFLFYMTPLVPFLVLGLTLALGVMLGPALRRGDTAEGADIADVDLQNRRRWGVAGVAVFLGLVIADFVWMWPLFSGGLMTLREWQAHMWLQGWV